MWAKNKIAIFVILIITIPCFFYSHHWLSRHARFADATPTSFYVQDYAYHIIVTKYFWLETYGNIYEPGFQLDALSAHMDKQVIFAMPVGIMPPALLLWLPFAYIADYSLPLSYLLWLAFSIAILLSALWQSCRYIQPSLPHHSLPITLSILTLLSSVSFAAVFLGQTSILAAGVLSLLIHQVRCGKQKGRTSWGIIVLVLFSSMKPQYLIIALGILIIYDVWRELFYSLTTIILLFIILTPMLTKKWILSYWQTIQMYTSGSFPDIYDWSIVPEGMNTLRSAVIVCMPDELTACYSALIVAIIYTGIGGAVILRKIGYSACRPIKRQQLVILLITGYLLFSPYSGGYEDLLMIPVFIAVLLTSYTPKLAHPVSIVIVCALLCTFFYPVPVFHNARWFFFMCKALVLGAMIIYSGKTDVMAKANVSL